MNKLFDLRFVIGSFFTIAGILLLIYSFTVSDAAAGQQAIENASSINRWCSIAFIVFGLIMIILSLRKDAHDEIIEETDDKPDGVRRGH
jgi:prolipoprotein diacylglyceryltransferase